MKTMESDNKKQKSNIDINKENLEGLMHDLHHRRDQIANRTCCQEIRHFNDLALWQLCAW